MILKLKEKELSFRWLQECDIDNIETQIKKFEEEDSKLDISDLYRDDYIYSEVEEVGYDGEYRICIYINDWGDYHNSTTLIEWELGETSREVADECEEELNKYLKFRFLEQEINNL